MPPAFVLSQDQTLHIIFEFLAHSLTCLRYFRFRKNCLNCRVRTIFYDSVFSIIWFVRFIQLFNFQRAFRRLATAFIYYHIIYILSTPFLNYFLNFQIRVRQLFGDSFDILSSTALLCQHLFSFLSVNLVYSSYFGLTKAFTIFKV